MSKDLSSKLKGWLGYVMIAWPVFKLLAKFYHVDLPDVPAGLGDILAAGSGAVGGTMLASSAPIMGKNSKA